MFQRPRYPGVILRKVNGPDFSESETVTDAGICTALNANGLSKTYSKTKRMAPFIDLLDWGSSKPEKIKVDVIAGNEKKKNLDFIELLLRGVAPSTRPPCG